MANHVTTWKAAIWRQKHTPINLWNRTDNNKPPFLEFSQRKVQLKSFPVWLCDVDDTLNDWLTQPGENKILILLAEG